MVFCVACILVIYYSIKIKFKPIFHVFFLFFADFIKIHFFIIFFSRRMNVRFFLLGDINTLILQYWCEKVQILSLSRHYILYIIT